MEEFNITKYKKIFVTGGTGFLGSNIVCELLKEGRIVGVSYRNKESLVKLDYKLKKEGVKTKYNSYNLDLECREEVAEVMKAYDVVIHAAASVDLSTNKDSYILKNIYLTRNVVWSAVNANIKRFVHISSIATLGEARDGESMIDEKCELISLSDKSGYSKSKFHSENEVFRAFHSGLNGVVLNPSVIIGYDRHSKSSAKIIKMLSREYSYYSDAITGYVGVKDVAKATSMMIDSDISLERVIVSGENLSYRELMIMSAEKLGLKPPTKQLSVSLLTFLKKIAETFGLIGLKCGISSSMIGCLISKKYYNGEKITEISNFRYTPIKKHLEDAINEYYDKK